MKELLLLSRIATHRWRRENKLGRLVGRPQVTIMLIFLCLRNLHCKMRAQVFIDISWMHINLLSKNITFSMIRLIRWDQKDYVTYLKDKINIFKWDNLIYYFVSIKKWEKSLIIKSIEEKELLMYWYWYVIVDCCIIINVEIIIAEWQTYRSI